MDFDSTIDIIIKDLREAREIIDDLKNYPGVPHLQIELIKSKCKSAEEIIALLKTMKQENQLPYSQKTEKIKIKKSSEPSSLDKLFEIGDEAGIDAESNLLNEEKPVAADQPVVKKPSAKIEIEKPAETTTVADKFTDASNTLYDQFGNLKKEPDISAVIKTKPVVNLTEAIGINEKFLFMHEIFNDNQESYNEAIEKLNSVANMPDARAVIMSYTGNNEESEATRQLLDLVRRKLAADE